MKPGDKYTLIHITENSSNQEVEILRLLDHEDSDSYYRCVEYRSPLNNATEECLMDKDTFLDLYEAVPESKVRYYRLLSDGHVNRVLDSYAHCYANDPLWERVYVCTAEEVGLPSA
jgi:hypothetical protein